VGEIASQHRQDVVVLRPLARPEFADTGMLSYPFQMLVYFLHEGVEVHAAFRGDRG
jgi:hypothetical protein